MLFIVESFDKVSELATIHVTFFDIPSRNILLVEKMSGKPGGFGLRNYWAAAIREVIIRCGKDYKKWERNYH